MSRAPTQHADWQGAASSELEHSSDEESQCSASRDGSLSGAGGAADGAAPAASGKASEPHELQGVAAPAASR
jgi:hypothetical protein